MVPADDLRSPTLVACKRLYVVETNLQQPILYVYP